MFCWKWLSCLLKFFSKHSRSYLKLENLNIHPTAIIGENVNFGSNVTIGPYSVIQNNVNIGSNSKIGNYVTVCNYTKIGENCSVFHNSSVGEIPQDLKFEQEKTETIKEKELVFG